MAEHLNVVLGDSNQEEQKQFMKGITRKWHQDLCLVSPAIQQEPVSFDEAMNATDSKQWKQATDDEYSY